MATELKVPSIGESVTEAEIYKWRKSQGDQVQKDETVAELETDKATFDLPAPVAGTLGKLLKKEGDTAEVGEVIGYINGDGDSEGESKTDDATKKDKKKKVEKQKDESEGEEDQKSAEKADTGEDEDEETSPRISPMARQLLKEHDLDADEVEGTGPSGRIMKDDVLKVVEAPDEAESSEQPDEADAERADDETHQTSDGRGEKKVRMSAIRRHIAERLVEAQQNAALLTTFNEIDMSAVLQLRQDHGERFKEEYNVKLGLMSFFVKATIDALKRYPELNAAVDGDAIVYRPYYDIGIAVATERGLVVPVIRDAQHLSFAEIEMTINDFADRAETFDLKPDELRGGTFTITNGGVFGSLLSTPIVNPPQSGVLGMHAIRKRPVAVGEDDRIEVRPMMYVALTYDHRIVDGREAVRCLDRIRDAIETPSRMLLEA